MNRAMPTGSNSLYWRSSKWLTNWNNTLREALRSCSLLFLELVPAFVRPRQLARVKACLAMLALLGWVAYFHKEGTIVPHRHYKSRCPCFLCTRFCFPASRSWDTLFQVLNESNFLAKFWTLLSPRQLFACVSHVSWKTWPIVGGLAASHFLTELIASKISVT